MVPPTGITVGKLIGWLEEKKVRFFNSVHDHRDEEEEEDEANLLILWDRFNNGSEDDKSNEDEDKSERETMVGMRTKVGGETMMGMRKMKTMKRGRIAKNYADGNSQVVSGAGVCGSGRFRRSRFRRKYW